MLHYDAGQSLISQQSLKSIKVSEDLNEYLITLKTLFKKTHSLVCDSSNL